MKKTILMLAFISCIGAFAQQRETKQKGDRAFKDMSTEQIATLKTKKMALALDLNQSQQAQVKSLVTEGVQRKKETMAKRKALKESDTKPTADQRFNMMNSELDYKLAVQTKMKKILNDDQYADWKKMAHRKHTMRKEGMKKRHTEKRKKMHSKE